MEVPEIEIEIGGESRWLRFDQGALLRFQKEVDPEEYSATAGYALIWAGLKSYAYAHKVPFVETFKTVCDWVDQLSNDVVLKVIKAFQETEAYKKMLPETDKKKSQPKSMKRNL